MERATKWWSTQLHGLGCHHRSCRLTSGRLRQTGCLRHPHCRSSMQPTCMLLSDKVGPARGMLCMLAWNSSTCPWTQVLHPLKVPLSEAYLQSSACQLFILCAGCSPRALPVQGMHPDIIRLQATPSDSLRLSITSTNQHSHHSQTASLAR